MCNVKLLPCVAQGGTELKWTCKFYWFIFSIIFLILFPLNCAAMLYVINSLGTADSVRTAARSRSGTDRVEFATGLMIGKDHSYCNGHIDLWDCLKTWSQHHTGAKFSMPVALCYDAGTAEEQAASHIKKEQYRQELLKQIGEQQRNKIKWVSIHWILFSPFSGQITVSQHVAGWWGASFFHREKKLELGVAATGATDREKEVEEKGNNRLKDDGIFWQSSL